MTKIVPTVGRIVLYTMAAYVADAINRRREHAAPCLDLHRMNANGVMIHVGNQVAEGDVLPAVVVRTWGDTPEAAINIKVMLDGTDDYWATSVVVEDDNADGSHTPGCYHWMPYQKGQAAKHDALSPEALASAKLAAGGLAPDIAIRGAG